MLPEYRSHVCQQLLGNGLLAASSKREQGRDDPCLAGPEEPEAVGDCEQGAPVVRCPVVKLARNVWVGLAQGLEIVLRPPGELA